MNTGEKRVKSKNNLLTGVAWGIGDKVEYAIEGSAFNAGSVIKWLRDELHMIDNAKRCDELAESVPDANGIYARGCIVGLTRGVNRAHIARSVLEAIAYQMTDLLEAMEDDSGITFTELRVDGGASVSDILLQIQSDMIRTIVDRQNREIEKIFTPQMEKSHRDELYKGWKRAVERSRDWAKD